MTTVKVLSFNVWHSDNSASGRQKIAQTILESRSHIVGMQEINDPNNAEDIRYHLGKNWFVQHQGWGMAVFSQFPIEETSRDGWGYKINLGNAQFAWIFNAHLTPLPYGPYQMKKL